MQNYKIPRKEILKLYESSLNEISAHSIGQWLKSVTDNSYVVIPKNDLAEIFHAVNDIEEGIISTIEVSKELKENWL